MVNLSITFLYCDCILSKTFPQWDILDKYPPLKKKKKKRT